MTQLCERDKQPLTNADSNASYDAIPSSLTTPSKPLETGLNLSAGIISNPDTPPQPAYATVKATLLLLLSSCLFSGMHSSVRYVTTRYPISSTFTVFFRGCIQTILATFLIFTFGNSTFATNLAPRFILLLCLRGLLGAGSILSRFKAVSLIPVGIATSLFATTPIFATVIGFLFFSESFSTTDKIALIITTVAAALTGTGTSDPSGTDTAKSAHLTGVLFALNSAALSASVFSIISRMGTRVHFLFSVLVMGIGSASAAFVTQSIERRSIRGAAAYFSDILLTADRGAWMGLSGVAFFGFAAALCMNRGTQFLSATRVGMLRSFDIPINFLAGYLLLGEFPQAPQQLIGCALIGVSTTLVAMKSCS